MKWKHRLDWTRKGVSMLKEVAYGSKLIEWEKSSLDVGYGTECII